MDLIDFTLNLAGLLLWLNWLAPRFDPLARPMAATLAGTLKKAAPPRLRGWMLVGALAVLLVMRAGFYWHIGPAVNWTPGLELGATAPSFRSDFFGWMLLYSCLSFGRILAGFYFWLLFLSFLGGRGSEHDPLLRLARAHLGPMVRWPWQVRLLVPGISAAVLWLLLLPLLVYLGIIPRPVSWAHRLEQATLLGASSYFAWKYLIAVLLALHILNSYVYLGSHVFWNFVTLAARSLLHPLRHLPLQASKVDLAPLVAIALVFLVAEFGGRGLTRIYGLLPF